jgi:type VI secretion system protein ImpL
MSSRLLHYLKILLLALSAPAIWALQAWLNGRLGDLLVSPLPLLIIFIGTVVLLGCWLMLRRRLGAGGMAEKIPSLLEPREQRVRNIVRAHKITFPRESRTFLVLNALTQQRSYPPSDAERPPFQDVVSREIGTFPLLEVQNNLLLQMSEEDSGLWWSVLTEFGSAAPRGVVLMIGVDQLLGYNGEQRHSVALTLRLRLAELAQRWGHWLPLQILVTECDALAGFLTAQSRLGGPLPPLNFTRGDNARTLIVFRQQMEALFPCPAEDLFERLEALPDRHSRRNDYVFQSDWEGLGKALQETLTLIFAPLRGQHQCWLQSLRFCAGRDNTTVYQTLQQAMNTARPNGRWRRLGRRYMAMMSLPPHVFWGALILIAVSGALVHFQSDRLRLERVAGHLAELEQPDNNSASIGSPNELFKQLNSIRRLLDESVARKITATRMLADDAERIYRSLLIGRLLPDSCRRLEQALVTAKTDDDAAMLLGHYLTLGGRASAWQTEQTVSWLSESWRNDPLIHLDEQQRVLLGDHLRALLSIPQIETGKLNKALIQRVRERLGQKPRLQRLLSRLFISQPERESEADSVIDLFFQHIDGLAVTSRFSGDYSRWGYRQLTKQLNHELPRVLATDNWLMGNAPERVTPALTTAILQVYFTNYIDYWDSFLKELTFVLPTGKGWETWMKRLAQKDSALFQLLETVELETQPTLSDSHNEESQSGSNPVSRHFSSLHHALTAGEFSEKLRVALLADTRSLQSTEQQDLLAESLAEAPQALLPLMQKFLAARRADLRQQRQMMLNEQWQTTVEASCRTTINGRYPFERQAVDEVSLADFTRLFAPRGELDRFMAQAGDEHPINRWFIHTERLQRFFFGKQDKQPALSLNVRPVQMHPDIDSFMLTDGEQVVRYAHGPILPVEFHWPSRSAARGLRAQIVLHNGEIRHFTLTGQWAWFRLFDQAIEPNGDGGETVTLDFSGYPVRLALTLPEGFSPVELLRDVSCPKEIAFG